jgi:nucleotidyltransferase substrate binding protein (TIGR01987 family)
MEELAQNLKTFEKALNTLTEILDEDFSIIVRDATIQRFEYTFEVFWKCVKKYLSENEGIICNSPKSCFRELLANNMSDIDTTEKLLEMTDMRNLTSHTYLDEIAVSIFEKIRDDYHKIMKDILIKLKEKGN